jgi:hypothetical protein
VDWVVLRNVAAAALDGSRQERWTLQLRKAIQQMRDDSEERRIDLDVAHTGGRAPQIIEGFFRRRVLEELKATRNVSRTASRGAQLTPLGGSKRKHP